MKVSAIIPYYNRESVISRAVASVLAQTHRNLEVIVVDDGSDDPAKLHEQLKKFDDRRISVIRHEQNLNGAAARNSGVRISTGDFIAFLDSDDEWTADKLEKQLPLVHSSSDTVVYCRYNTVTSSCPRTGSTTAPRRVIRRDESMGDYLFRNGGFIQTSGLLLSRELAVQVPFNEALKRHQDYDLLLRLGSLGSNFVMANESLVTVHWETLHETTRGLDPPNTLAFVREYQQYLSPEAATGFLFKQIVLRLLRARRRREAISMLRQHIKATHLRGRDWLRLVSMYVFADERISKAANTVKNRISPVRV